ncbi:uncharacterized protein LACBIDRAFT_296659 [Laccaria bicolor S238N-H82]|uniref:Uncharacterized protein n=1 Tax=Laccaria bicolor (strain S238N-H82 / ATCC MYA-4686) TaxID=486041 RepID=B0D9D1_LACBS|nr:uncharacterized protein LACBIDRAFT_296659 [Laccaria bicolor S238N-H82]EDR08997.1 hypothetical protein LACBIDRAFT_296659 [Laccaria bicolor S238N-H82]|eukprot:XP_001880310.1 hypothetical protein LACBIDRAFT_296659 [Laccaria bicolor S238N-H82]
MTRSIARKPKRRSKAQIQSLHKADLARWPNRHDEEAENGMSASEKTIHDLKHQLSDYEQQLKNQKTKYWNERRRNHRLQKAHVARKVDLKHIKEQAYRMRGALQMLGKELGEVQAVADESICLLQARVKELQEAKKNLTQTSAVLRKRTRKITSQLKSLKERMRKKRQSSEFRMTRRGIYTQQTRALARLMVSSGMKITYSSDSTSHKHIEFESRTIALKVVDYLNPTKEPKWTMRTLGVGTSVNHTSEMQVNGLKERLQEIAEIFNNSPLAKPDQKKSHEILRIWRMEVILQRLGEEALFQMDVTRVIALFVPLKGKQIEKHGGQEAWDKLTEDKRATADIEIIREVGKQVFEKLPEDHQRCLTSFIRTGCCMHKDLNCVKWGDKAVQGMWEKENKTPPILLANKDNAAVLAGRTESSTQTNAEIRAEEVSKHGGSHTTALGGMICRNKDTKKGQQDTYDYYMLCHVGHRVPYPDVSNTCYGSHGEAAGTIIAYHQHFINFMEFVRNTKDKPGEMNIEKNFANALKDTPTLTELCVLALYHVNISQPFMKHVRAHKNLLDLKSFFENKVTFLNRVIGETEIWTSQEFTHEAGTLDGDEWDEWGMKVMNAVKELAPSLPDLKSAILAFVSGARDTFVERFSDEFKEAGDIDKLTEAERQTLFFSPTNDGNEGALRSLRLGKRRRPGETLHKFNALFTARQNHTEEFMSEKLKENVDHIYLRQVACTRDESHFQRRMKEAQIESDKAKVAENVLKEAKKQGKRNEREAMLVETGKS